MSRIRNTLYLQMLSGGLRGLKMREGDGSRCDACRCRGQVLYHIIRLNTENGLVPFVFVVIL